jgi:ribonuclease HII
VAVLTNVLAAGIDDAGRGSMVGPMVIAGVLYYNERMEELRKLGVKDSKKLTPTQREKIAENIRSSVLAHHIVEVQPEVIDKTVMKGRKLRRLNFLEAKAMAEVILRLKPQIAYVDSCDVKPERFASQILELLSTKVKIVSEHEADSKYPIVGAASILAKVHRDRIIDALRRKYGDFGSGYPSDPKTARFLENWFKAYRKPPPFFRKSWKPVKALTEKMSRGQIKL